ncbi:lipopolysaccharide biosynthesis protein [Francisellaceae bacterium]|nr:lipopolysaccharide biosynthesis protein [Francisellaceae bacterium]
MIRKFLTYGVGSIGTAIISFMTVPILTRILDPSNYGKGGLYLTIVTFLFYICNIGLDMGYMRFFFEKNSKLDKIQLFYQCLLIVFILYLIVVCVFFLNRRYVLDFFFEGDSIGICLAIMLGLLFFILNRFSMLSLRIQQRAFLYSLAQILNALINFLGIIIFYYGYDIVNFTLIVYSQFFSLFCVSLLLILLDLERWKIKKYFRISVTHWSQFNATFKYSWPFLFSFLIIWGMQYIDRIFLIKLSSFDQLGIYSAAFSLTAPMVMFQGIFTTMWAPIGNKILIDNSFKGKYIYHVLYKNMSILMFLGVVFVFSIKDVLIYVLGENFRGAVYIFLWLLFLPIFNLLSQLLNAGIIKSKKTKWNIWASTLGFIVNLIACYVLIPSLHALGAAISLVAGSFMFFLVKMLSNYINYPFKIHHFHFVLSLLVCVISFIFIYLKLILLSWVFILTLLAYQILLMLRKQNISMILKVLKLTSTPDNLG